MTKQSILDIIYYTLLSIGTCAICACEEGLGANKGSHFLKEMSEVSQ